MSVGSCTTHTVAGVHCIPMMATHLTNQNDAVIGLTITLATVTFILVVVVVTTLRNRWSQIRNKVYIFSW